MRNESVVAYPRDELDWQTINVRGFGDFLLTWVFDDIEICTWW